MIPELAVVDAAIETATIRLLQSARLTPIAIDGRQYIPVDIDTSPLDNSKSHKEGVSRTYKQFDSCWSFKMQMHFERPTLNCARFTAVLKNR